MPVHDSHLALLTDHRLGVLVTLKADGRPQLSNVAFAYDARDRTVRVSTREHLAKVRNLRRDPRVTLYVTEPDGSAYAGYEGVAALSPVAADPHDPAVDELVTVYRAIGGEHPDWDGYRAAMVADRRLVVRFRPTHTYGGARG